MVAFSASLGFLSGADVDPKLNLKKTASDFNIHMKELFSIEESIYWDRYDTNKNYKAWVKDNANPADPYRQNFSHIQKKGYRTKINFSDKTIATPRL